MQLTQKSISKNSSLLEFDYQSTTPCNEEVLESMSPYWSDLFGNPSSRQNRLGITASAAVDLAREKIANDLNVSPQRIIFTSGATEANNLALIGYSRAKALKVGRPGHLITVSTEHHAVLDPLRQLRREGFRLTEIVPGPNGLISKQQLVNAFEDDTFLVSVMVANNEIGVLQPILELSTVCKERGVIFHSDAAQGLGYLELDPDSLGIDLMSISAHKIYGPKGIGALLFRPDLPMTPLQWGGGQEQSLRPGTLPVPLIIGFAKALEISLRDLSGKVKKMSLLRDKLWDGLKSNSPDLILNGDMERRLPNNLNFTIPDVIGIRLHRELRSSINCSNASACMNGEVSHVLLAIGRSNAEAQSSLRLSLGRDTSEKHIQEAVQIISNLISQLRGRKHK